MPSVATDKQRTSRDLVKNAYGNATVIPAFNIPYLPMMTPAVQALADTNSFGSIQVSYAKCLPFEAMSQEAAKRWVLPIRIFEPCKDNAPRYNQRFAIYKSLYEAMKPIGRKLTKLKTSI